MALTTDRATIGGWRAELRVFSRLYQLMKPFPLKTAAILGLGFAASLAEGLGLSLFLPFLESLKAVDSAASSGLSMRLDSLFAGLPEDWRIVVIPLCIFGAIALKNLLLLANSALAAWLNVHISHRLRSDVFGQLLIVSDRYFNQQKPGDLLNILASETWRTSEALNRLVQLSVSGCTVFVFAGLMLLLSWPLTLSVTVAMLAISLLVRILTRRIKRFGERAVKANSLLTTRMCEGLAGMRTIRSFSQEAYEQRRLDVASKRVSRIFFQLNWIMATTDPVYEVLAAAMLLAVLAIALSQSWVSVPTLLIFVLILYKLQPRVKSISNNYIALLGLMSAVDAVLSFISPAGKSYIESGARSFAGLRGEIAFKDVSFQYDLAETAALKDISLSIPAGKTTALVGPSGAGKSTLINLLFRFYDPTAGQIFADNQPLASLRTADWRSRMALVSQDIYLFSGTVRDNIAYGQPTASREEVAAAARRANAHAFICELPMGYETQVGDRGVNLSGGQRQRIALARAIVCDPDILILDEATNALDTLSEKAIQTALEDFARDRTVIAIAHRLSTIEKADQIVVMQSGQIAERGTLSELLAQEGLFFELYQLQYRHALARY